MITQRDTAMGEARFHTTVKAGTQRLPLEVNAEYQPRLVAVEIDEIKAGG